MYCHRRTVSIIVAAVAVLLCTLAGATVHGAALYQEGALVLRMQPGHSVDEVLSTIDGQISQHLIQLDIYLVTVSGDPDLEDLAGSVEALPGVDFCQPNFMVDPLQSVQGSLPVSDQQRVGDFGDQEAVHRLKLDETHSQSTGAGVRIALLDGGANYEHPVLSENVIKRRDYIDSDDDPLDEPGGPNSGHGTFVAGVVKLAAPGAEFYAYRVTDIDGLSNGYVLAEAIIQAVNDGCRVINLSLVTTRPHEAIAEAAAYAAAHNVLIVAAAGNGHTPDAHYPASDPNVLSIAAVDTLDLLADFSCYGPHVDICAPGTGLYGPYLDDTYAWWGGTSFAAPFVAAQAALLWHYKPSATREEVIDAILSTAVDLDHINEELTGQLGAGLIDPLQSIITIRGGSKALRVPSEYPTIQAAINASLPGDTVLVAPGEYVENLAIMNKYTVVVLGESGAEQTIIKPALLDQSSVYVVGTGPDGVPEIAGFTFTGASNRVVVHIDGYAAKLHDNIFRDNNVGIDIPTPGNSKNPVVIDQYGNFDVSTDITRNVFVSNGGEAAIRIGGSGPNGVVYITNNTFVDNTRAIIGNSHYFWTDGYDIYMYGNAFVGSRYEAIAEGAYKELEDLEVANVKYNLFWNNATPWEDRLGYDSSLQVFADPVYANAALGDVRLLPGSPAIDAGHPDPIYSDPDNSRNDIGARWFTSLPMPFVKDLAFAGCATLTPELHWTYVDDPPSTQQMFQVQVGDDPYWDVAEMWDSGPTNSSSTAVIYSGSPLSNFTPYYFRTRVHNGVQWGDWYEIEGMFRGTGSVYVPTDVATIQEAVDLAIDGDTIFVEPGAYVEAVSIVEKDLTILSTMGRDVTTITSYPGAEASVLVRQGTSSVHIGGFTFSGGTTGARFDFGSSGWVRGCRFTGMESLGLESRGAAQTEVVNCEFVDNAQPVYVRSVTDRFDSNYVSGSDKSAVFSGDTFYVRNNIFARNSAALKADRSSYGEVSGNTVYGTNGIGLELLVPGDCFNNLVVFNKGVGIKVENSGMNARYNNAFGNLCGDRSGYTEVLGGLAVDPRLVDTVGATFGLLFDSPCIDAGDPNPQYNDPDDSRSDIGGCGPADIGYPVAANISFDPVNAFGAVRSQTFTINWNYADPEASGQYQYQVQLGDVPLWLAAPLWDSGPVVSSDNQTIYTGPSLNDHARYWLRLRVHDGSTWGDWVHAAMSLSVDGTLEVPGDYATIAEALTAAYSGDTIMIGPGVHRASVDLNGKSIVFTSRDGAASTEIRHATEHWIFRLQPHDPPQTSIENLTLRPYARCAVTCKGSSVTMKGCVVVGCSATAVVCDSVTDVVTISDCTFRGNGQPSATGGGAISATRGQYVIENNRFFDNGRDSSIWSSSINGGAVRLSQTVNTRVCRNLFAGNIATYGGAIHVVQGQDVKIYNNTFYENVAWDSTGGTCLYIKQDKATGQEIFNNIMVDNRPGYALVSSSRIPVNYNDVYPNATGGYRVAVPGAQSISVDPLFVDPDDDDFRLAAGSPCIDAGDPRAEFIESDGTVSDMGAFPYEWPRLMPVAQAVNLGDEDRRRVVSTTPTFFWSYLDTLGAQQSFEFQIASPPTGWTAEETWSSGEVNSSDTSFAYTGPALILGSNHMARVRVNNGLSWGSWSYVGLHINSGPALPQFKPATLPEARYIVGVSFPSCADAEGDSVFYDIQFATDSAMTNIIGQVQHGPTSSLNLGYAGALGATYHWRARATDGLITTPWVQTTYVTEAAGGQVELLAPTKDRVPCGQTVRFVLGIENDQALPLLNLVNGFTISSPDGAAFTPVSSRWAFEDSLWDEEYKSTFSFIGAARGGTVDSLTVLGLILPNNGHVVPAGGEGVGWIFETTVSCDDAGKQICLDKFDHTSHGAFHWDWHFGVDPDHIVDRTCPGWGGPFCFEIVQCCQGVRGDVNEDGEECTITDISAIVDHLFLTCSDLACYEEANLNADWNNEVSISDISYGVDHLFLSQRDLIPCSQLMSAPAPKSGTAAAVLWQSVRHDTTRLYLSSDMMLRGLQLTLVGDGDAAAVKDCDLPVDLIQGKHGDTLKLGLIDLGGPGVIEIGDWSLVRIPGEYSVIGAGGADMAHQEVVLTVKNGDPNLPTRFELFVNYPNPFNPVTRIEFALPRASKVNLTVYNILGQTVDVLLDKAMEPGYHGVDWNAGKYASGVYFYRLRAEGFLETRKMLLIK